MHRIDAEPDAMRKQRVSALDIECEQRVPQVTWISRQLLGPLSMPVVDSLRDSGVTETGRLAAEHDALCVDLNAGLGRVSVEEVEAESMERCHERYIRILCHCVA